MERKSLGSMWVMVIQILVFGTRIMDNKTIVTEFFNEAYTKKNYDYIMQYFSEEYIDNSPANARSNVDVVKVLEEVEEQYSELRAEVVDVFAENCMVAVRVLFEGIHSGKRINFEALEYFKVENEKIVESWGY